MAQGLLGATGRPGPAPEPVLATPNAPDAPFMASTGSPTTGDRRYLRNIAGGGASAQSGFHIWSTKQQNDLNNFLATDMMRAVWASAFQRTMGLANTLAVRHTPGRGMRVESYLYVPAQGVAERVAEEGMAGIIGTTMRTKIAYSSRWELAIQGNLQELESEMALAVLIILQETVGRMFFLTLEEVILYALIGAGTVHNASYIEGEYASFEGWSNNIRDRAKATACVQSAIIPSAAFYTLNSTMVRERQKKSPNDLPTGMIMHPETTSIINTQTIMHGSTAQDGQKRLTNPMMANTTGQTEVDPMVQHLMRTNANPQRGELGTPDARTAPDFMMPMGSGKADVSVFTIMDRVESARRLHATTLMSNIMFTSSAQGGGLPFDLKASSFTVDLPRAEQWKMGPDHQALHIEDQTENGAYGAIPFGGALQYCGLFEGDLSAPRTRHNTHGVSTGCITHMGAEGERSLEDENGNQHGVFMDSFSGGRGRRGVHATELRFGHVSMAPAHIMLVAKTLCDTVGSQDGLESKAELFVKALNRLVQIYGSVSKVQTTMPMRDSGVTSDTMIAAAKVMFGDENMLKILKQNLALFTLEDEAHAALENLLVCIMYLPYNRHILESMHANRIYIPVRLMSVRPWRAYVFIGAILMTLGARTGELFLVSSGTRAVINPETSNYKMLFHAAWGVLVVHPENIQYSPDIHCYRALGGSSIEIVRRAEDARSAIRGTHGYASNQNSVGDVVLIGMSPDAIVPANPGILLPHFAPPANKHINRDWFRGPVASGLADTYERVNSYWHFNEIFTERRMTYDSWMDDNFRDNNTIANSTPIHMGETQLLWDSTLKEFVNVDGVWPLCKSDGRGSLDARNNGPAWVLADNRAKRSVANRPPPSTSDSQQHLCPLIIPPPPTLLPPPPTTASSVPLTNPKPKPNHPKSHRQYNNVARGRSR